MRPQRSGKAGESKDRIFQQGRRTGINVPCPSVAKTSTPVWERGVRMGFIVYYLKHTASDC